jgi:hypothetical protein
MGWRIPSGENVFARRAAAPLAAVMGCLQPAIDPLFLTLLSQATSVPLAAHGWIVGVTQGAAAIGALACWRLGDRAPAQVGVLLGAGALAAAGLTPFAQSVAAVLALRAVFGFAMGAIYARAMAAFATRRPVGAYGLVLLTQLLAATAISLVLPICAARYGVDAALLALGIVPGVAMGCMALVEGGGRQLVWAAESKTPRAGWAMAWGNMWFIGATMMVWSLSGALAIEAGLSEAAVGHAVALGSLAGVVTALMVIREKRWVPMPVTAVLVGGCLLSPLLLTGLADGLGYMTAMVLLNIGSTAIIIRCSALATIMALSARFRIFVAATHNLGMTIGPALGSAAIWAMPNGGLLIAASFAVAAGIACVVAGSLDWRQRCA